MQNLVDIKPEVLTWAVQRAGKEVEAMEYHNLRDWLTPATKPTFRQLQEFAKMEYVPFGYLFLTELPELALPIPFSEK